MVSCIAQHQSNNNIEKEDVAQESHRTQGNKVAKLSTTDFAEILVTEKNSKPYS